MGKSKEPEGSTSREANPPAASLKFREHLRPAIAGVFALTLLTGCVFPVLVFVIGRSLFPRQADGSLVSRDGIVIGSKLVGQQFARPEYFHPRPSAAGNGYEPDDRRFK